MSSTLLVLLLLSSVASLSSAQTSNQTLWYVKPTEGYNCSFSPCSTLAAYLNTVFQSDTTLIFLPGTHLVDTEGVLVEFKNLTNLYFVGTGESVPGELDSLEPSSRIECSDRSGFAFINVSNLSFTNLTKLFSCTKTSSRVQTLRQHTALTSALHCLR